MTTYKPHYACFACRKVFKRRLLWDINRDDKRSVEAKCPQCGELMADMGLDFAAPKKDDVKAWKHIQSLYSVGITFHSCGCVGPGYIPNSKEDLVAHFQYLLAYYNTNLAFWRQRIAPTNDNESNREKSKHLTELIALPIELRRKGAVRNEDAKKYWIERIKEVQAKIDSL